MQHAIAAENWQCCYVFFRACLGVETPIGIPAISPIRPLIYIPPIRKGCVQSRIIPLPAAGRRHLYKYHFKLPLAAAAA